MAKNKKNNGTKNADKAEASPREQPEAEPSGTSVTDDSAATAAPASDMPQGESAQSGTTTAVHGDSEDPAALRQRLEAATQEIASLKAQLAQRDAEVAALKQGGAVAGGLAPASEDIQGLQERLQRLKKEQAEADSAREAAWRQLKAVVSEISRLAGPDAKPAIAQPVA